MPNRKFDRNMAKFDSFQMVKCSLNGELKRKHVLLRLSIDEELQGRESSDTEARAELLVGISIDLGDGNIGLSFESGTKLLVLLQVRKKAVS